MSDQQRSEAVTEKKRCCCQCGKEMWCYISEEVQAAIAERDATIAALRAEVTRARETVAQLRLIGPQRDRGISDGR